MLVADSWYDQIDHSVFAIDSKIFINQKDMIQDQGREMGPCNGLNIIFRIRHTKTNDNHRKEKKENEVLFIFHFDTLNVEIFGSIDKSSHYNKEKKAYIKSVGEDMG